MNNGQTDGKVTKIKPSALEAANDIIKKDGIKGLWRGIGPALILVINPVIQVSRKLKSMAGSSFIQEWKNDLCSADP